MGNKGDYYSCVACYFDDIIAVHKETDHVFDSIRVKVFTIKEMLAPDYFLGRNPGRLKEPKTKNKIMTWGSKIYGKRMMDNFKNTFGFDPSEATFRNAP